MINTTGVLRQGETRAVFEGKDGVWMMDAPITKVKGTDRLETSLSNALNLDCPQAEMSAQLAAVMNNTVEQALGFRATNFASEGDAFSALRGLAADGEERDEDSK